MWIVYLIQHNFSKQIYIGFTSNLRQRMLSHNSGHNKSTKRLQGEWQLIYAEAYRAKQDAQTRERKLKQYGQAKQKLVQRLKKSLFDN